MRSLQQKNTNFEKIFLNSHSKYGLHINNSLFFDFSLMCSLIRWWSEWLEKCFKTIIRSFFEVACISGWGWCSKLSMIRCSGQTWAMVRRSWLNKSSSFYLILNHGVLIVCLLLSQRHAVPNRAHLNFWLNCQPNEEIIKNRCLSLKNSLHDQTTNWNT